MKKINEFLKGFIKNKLLLYGGGALLVVVVAALAVMYSQGGLFKGDVQLVQLPLLQQINPVAPPGVTCSWAGATNDNVAGTFTLQLKDVSEYETLEGILTTGKNDISVSDAFNVGSVNPSFDHIFSYGISNPGTYNTSFAGKVRKYNGSGYDYSDVSATCLPSPIIVTVPVAPLSAPTNLVATPGDGEIDLTWNMVSGATSYSIYQGAYPGTEIAKNVTASPHTIAALTNGTSYIYFVKAVNSNVESSPSNSVSATPVAAPAAPAAPPGLKATAKDKQIDLEWTTVSAANDGYNIYKSKVSNTYTEVPDHIAYANALKTTFSDTNVQNGTKYYYVVRAVKDALESANSSEVSATPVSSAPAFSVSNCKLNGTTSDQTVDEGTTNNWTVDYAAPDAPSGLFFVGAKSGGGGLGANTPLSKAGNAFAVGTGYAVGTYKPLAILIQMGANPDSGNLPVSCPTLTVKQAAPPPPAEVSATCNVTPTSVDTTQNVSMTFTVNNLPASTKFYYILYKDNQSSGGGDATGSATSDANGGYTKSAVSLGKYAAAGTYTPAVSLTWGNGLSKNVNCMPPMTVKAAQTPTPTPLAISCYPNPSSAVNGSTVTWFANVTGGDPNTIKAFGWSTLGYGLSGTHTSSLQNPQYTYNVPDSLLTPNYTNTPLLQVYENGVHKGDKTCNALTITPNTSNVPPYNPPVVTAPKIASVSVSAQPFYPLRSSNNTGRVDYYLNTDAGVTFQVFDGSAMIFDAGRNDSSGSHYWSWDGKNYKSGWNGQNYSTPFVVKNGSYTFKIIAGNSAGTDTYTGAGGFVVNTGISTTSTTTTTPKVKTSSNYCAGFTDVWKSNTFCAAITKVTEAGIFAGYADNTFRPSEYINRAEAAKVLAIAYNIPYGQVLVSVFPDVESTDWYATYVKSLKDQQIVRGYNDGLFKPDNQVTRAEFVKMVVAASGADISSCNAAAFRDAPLNVWYGKYLCYAKSKGLINGDEFGNFNPNMPITRAEVASILYRALNTGLLVVVK